MKKLFIIPVLFLSYFTQAQEVAGTTELQELDLKKTQSEIFSEVEKPAVFPKGTTFFRQMIAKKFREKKVIGNGIEKCELIFVIEKDGTLSGIKARGVNESFNNEAIRAISKIKDKWIPAEINGRKVRYYFRIPLTMNFE